MNRFAVICLCLSLGACSQAADVASAASDQARVGLTALGEKVQGAQKQVAKAMPDIQDQAQDSVDTVKDALTTVGDTTVAVGQVTTQTLTAIGSTVMEATGAASAPEGAAQ